MERRIRHTGVDMPQRGIGVPELADYAAHRVSFWELLTGQRRSRPAAERPGVTRVRRVLTVDQERAKARRRAANRVARRQRKINGRRR